MFTTAIIAFREFLEAFLIVGIFLGLSRKLNLKKETEVILAACVGVVVSLLLTTGTYIFGDYVRAILTEENADALESYLMIFSGLFIAYVVFSLHDVMHRNTGSKFMKAHKKLKENVFDFSLFLSIVFIVAREGFEIALFTSSVSLFATFMQNFIGLLIGFAAGSLVGISTFFAYIKFPVKKVYKWTEYMIVLLGAALVQHGITEFLETHFDIHISDIGSFNLHFLPDEDTFIGHLLQGLLGLDNEFSVVRLAIMVVYITLIYILFLKQHPTKPVHAKK